MRSYFFILALLIIGCSSQSTAPLMVTPRFGSFTKVRIFFNRIPSKETTGSGSWRSGRDPEGTKDSAFYEASGFWSNDSLTTFSHSGDTLYYSFKIDKQKTDGYQVGQTLTIKIDSLQDSILFIRYQNDSTGYYGSSCDFNVSSEMVCSQMSYTLDSAKHLKAFLNGKAMLGKFHWSYSSSNNCNGSSFRTYSDKDVRDFGDVLDSSSITITLMP